MERQQVFFHGRVQGVGFRYTVKRIAEGHPIQGFVRNLADGQVELVAEGTKSALTQFVAEIETAMQGHIRQVDIHTSAPQGGFSGFEIRF